MNASNSELQRLLARLREGSNLTVGQLSSNELNGSSAAGISSNDVVIPGLGDLPPEAAQDQAPVAATPDPRRKQAQLQAPKPELGRPRSTTPAVSAVPDASTIATWPAAVKHVTKHIVQNEQTAARIKHLINEQHKHEEQWWKQRQELMAKHASRPGNQTKVADILKELGGLSVPIAKVDEAADRSELETYDKKVYKSLNQMAVDFDGQLRKLGVPFFAIKHDLVMTEKTNVRNGGEGVKLDKGELRELQKRMLQILEDLLID